MPGEQQQQQACDLLETLWLMPPELRIEIFKHTSILTQWLHGQLPLPISELVLRLILAECFQLNKLGVARALPLIEATWELGFVHTAEMESIARHRSNGLFNQQYCGTLLAETPSSFFLYPFLVLIRDLASKDRTDAALILPVAHSLLDFIACRTLPHITTCAIHFAETLAECAAGLGRLDLLDPLLNRICYPTHRTFDLAGKNGHIHIFQRLHSRQLTANISLNGAIEGGHLPTINYLITMYPTLTVSKSAVETAIKLGVLSPGREAALMGDVVDAWLLY
eukprot:jgi/Hompol1/44/HPOL_005207-RA